MLTHCFTTASIYLQPPHSPASNSLHLCSTSSNCFHLPATSSNNLHRPPSITSTISSTHLYRNHLPPTTSINLQQTTSIYVNTTPPVCSSNTHLQHKEWRNWNHLRPHIHLPIIHPSVPSFLLLLVQGTSPPEVETLLNKGQQ